MAGSSASCSAQRAVSAGEGSPPRGSKLKDAWLTRFNPVGGQSCKKIMQTLAGDRHAQRATPLDKDRVMGGGPSPSTV